MVDNAWSNWKAWSNRYWPTIYLIDRAGYVRYRWQGELNYNNSGGYKEVQKRIEELLGETLGEAPTKTLN